MLHLIGRNAATKDVIAFHPGSTPFGHKILA
jgi:hypothetical protein